MKNLIRTISNIFRKIFRQNINIKLSENVNCCDNDHQKSYTTNNQRSY